MKRTLTETALEFCKLRGTGLWLVALLSGMAAIFLSLYLVVADQGTAYTFALFTGNIISNTQSELLPCTAVFLLGQMMERERTCGALKNLLAVPLTFRRLLGVKAAACAVMTLLYSAAQWAFALAAAVLAALSGCTAARWGCRGWTPPPRGGPSSASPGRTCASIWPCCRWRCWGPGMRADTPPLPPSRCFTVFSAR